MEGVVVSGGGGVNGVGSNVPSLRYKRRKVSANRDFPNGCGRFAPRIDVKPSENIVGAETPAAGIESAKQPGSLVEPRTVDRVDNLEQIGSPRTVDRIENSEQIRSSTLVKNSFSETVNLLDSLDQADVVAATTKTGEPVAGEIPEALDHTESSNVEKTSEPDTMDLPLNVSRPQVEEMPSDLMLQLPVDSYLPDTLLSTKVFEEHQIFVPLPQNSGPVLDDVERSSQKKYPKRRRVSASRDFPRGCGRNAPPVSREECLKPVAPSKERSLVNQISSKEMEQVVRFDSKQMREKAQDGDAFNINSKRNVTKENSEFRLEREIKKDEVRDIHHVRETSDSKLRQKDTEVRSKMARENSLPRSDLKSPSFNKKFDKEVGNSEEKMKLSKVTSLKRKFPRSSEDNNYALSQSQREDSIGMETSDDRVIVQALMAEPNCPWRQGKRGFKSPISASQSTAKSKPKLQIVMQEKKVKTVSSKGKAKKKSMSPTGEAAFQGVRDLVLRDEDISPGNDEEDDKFSLVPRSKGMDLSLIPFGLHTLTDSVDHGDALVTRNKVRETLRLFQAIFRKFLQDEEAKSKSQVNSNGRIDLIAAKILKEKHKWVNTGKQILGPVPGVEVGDEFHYRVELAIIGLHRPFQGGIDCLKRGSQLLATSIVASGGYDDDTENSDVMVYSGSGGHPTGADKKADDQKLKGGNLALKNSIDERTPVRVVRGFKEAKGSDFLDARGKIVTTYTYDGLYLVEKYWIEKGRHGNNVFMFQLRRIPGQPELALKEVKNSKKLRVREGLCVDDISQGKEKVPISAVNIIDDEKPPPFEYITKMIYPSWYDLVPPKGCDCIDGCSDSIKCFCAVKNGGELPFNHNGAIVEAKPLVYECGPSCKCPPSCHNRVSQHGIRFQLEIFKTKSRGWGVRSLASIPSGSFICEYTGELLQDKEAEQRTGNDEYLFDIGHNYSDRALWDGLSTLIPLDLQSSSSRETLEDVGFTIDAAQYGNVGRFINHSCSPNLYAQNVLYDHDEKRMPHIMLFAAENIPPLQELTYHYNYELDQVHDSDGNIKKKDCYCGSLECTGRMY